MESLFLELGTILIFVTLLGFIARLLKQPLILAYIVTGIIAGPMFFNIVKSTDTLSTLSHIGIAFLLFLVGINLNFRVLKEVGKISLITGIGQVIFTFIIAYFITIALGFSQIAALYVGIALTFSSTIIIVKLLSDKNDLDTLYGKIAIGYLLVQDFIAIFLLFIIGGGFSQATSIPASIFLSLIKGSILIVVILLANKFFLPKLFERFCRTQELLLLSSVAWCLLMGILSYKFGFSIEIGSFLAGVSLSTLPYHYEIAAKVKVLRDFFLILFFVILGAQMKFISVNHLILPIIILSLFVLLGKPLVIMMLMGISRYKKRTGFLTGLTSAQVSEFSFILIALGLGLGHISAEISTIVTSIGIITIVASAYMINYNNKLYSFFSRHISIFERKGTYERKYLHRQISSTGYDLILFGCHKMGFNIVKNIEKIKKKTLVVDFNPEIIKKFAESKIDALYGDASDKEILDKTIRLKPKIVISTIPSFDANLHILKQFKKRGKNVLVIVTSENLLEALELYKNKADFVILPEFLAGQKIVDYLVHLDKQGIRKWGKHHIKTLLEDSKIQ